MKINIFTKVIIFVTIMIGTFIVFYTYSNKVSVSVVEKEITNENFNQLGFLMRQIDAQIDLLSFSATVLSGDTTVRQFQYLDTLEDMYGQTEIVTYLQDKLRLQSTAASWVNTYSITSLPTRKTVLSNDYIDLDEAYILKYASSDWTFREALQGEQEAQFIRSTFIPSAEQFQPDRTQLVIESRFSVKNLRNMLDSYKSGGQGDPFLYHKETGFITTSTAQNAMLKLVVDQVESRELGDRGHFVTSLEGKEYLINYIKSDRIDQYLIDYLPLEQILSPIMHSRNLFYVSIILLIVMGLIASYLLYRHVQVPIRYLVRGVGQIQRGVLSARIPSQPNNEFDYLFVRFNEMATQIQLLIENVYQEKLRSREATLKQLQSQINPHFLYNSLFFVKNMAKLGEIDSVVAMTDNLGDYYRYVTRVENQLPLLRDELELVRNYLVIQNLRMDRIQYVIEVSENMQDQYVPRLIVQPIVENAIIHGLEPKAEVGKISIYGREQDDSYELIVEDNGDGMTAVRYDELIDMLNQSRDEDMGCGLWNVHQRLKLQFKEGSGLIIDRLDTGTRITLRWMKS